MTFEPPDQRLGMPCQVILEEMDALLRERSESAKVPINPKLYTSTFQQVSSGGLLGPKRFQLVTYWRCWYMWHI